MQAKWVSDQGCAAAVGYEQEEGATVNTTEHRYNILR